MALRTEDGHVQMELFDMGEKKPVGLTQKQLDELWAAYPKKVKKRQAMTAMIQAGKRATFETIRDGLLVYVAYLQLKQTLRQFINNPTTWFNGDGWLDEYPATGAVRNPKWPPRYRPIQGGPGPTEWIEREIENGRDPWAK